MTMARHAGAALAAAVVIWALSVSLSAFRDYQMADVAVYVVAIAGLTVLIGQSGQISLGNGAFMAIGAYATALLQLHLNWPLWALFPASAVIASVAGVAVGVVAAEHTGKLGREIGQGDRADRAGPARQPGAQPDRPLLARRPG